MSEDAGENGEKKFSVIDRRFWAKEGAGETSAEAEERPKKPSYVEELEAKVALAEKRAEEAVARQREAKLEFEEARARLSRDVGVEVERHRRAMLQELLDVADNLDRAVDGAAAAKDVATVHQGITLVRDQFMGALGNLGLRRGASLGIPFDPTRHEAITTVPVTDPALDNQVLGVIREAYFIGDEVLRVARVAVGRAPVEASTPSGAASNTAVPPAGPVNDVEEPEDA